MVTIDIAEEADIAELVQLKAYCFLKEEAAGEVALHRRVKASLESFLVMKKNGVITGTISSCVGSQHMTCDAMYKDESLHDPYDAYQTVLDLGVYPVYQHQGYAGELIQALIEAAKKERGKGVVSTCEEHLVGLYEQPGYHNMGVSASVHGDTEWYDMLLCLV